jgi:hypothetical protein
MRVKEVSSSLLRQTKWFKYKLNVQVGDVVLRRDENCCRTESQICKWLEILPARTIKISPCEKK